MEALRIADLEVSIDPRETLGIISRAAKENNHVYFRVFNVRSNKDHYVMHKGTHSFLFRDPNTITVMDWVTAEKTLEYLDEVVKRSNYLDFEIIPEGEITNE